MSSVGRTVSGAAGRLLARPQTRREGYAFCSDDGYWFRPAYTEGKCPLCGTIAVGAALPPPRRQLDRSWLGMALLGFESLAMLALVLLMYFRH